MTARRDGERGLSLIEAIVIATITSLLALLILPLLPRASANSLRVAERGVGVLDEMRGEREFRMLVRGVSAREIEGEPQAVVVGDAGSAVLAPVLAASVSCARAGAPVVRLSVESGALVCLSDGRRRALLRWSGDRVGALSYSADGAAWLSSWNAAEIAPFVRFELRRAGRVEAVWAERAMGDAS